MKAQPVFLETTIQIQRILAPLTEQEELERHLKEIASRAYTSPYVWMEFQRTVVADYAHLHNLMLSYNSWGNVMTHLMSGQRGFRLRSAGRCLQILGLIYEASQGHWDDAFILLENGLQSDLRMRFWTNVTTVSDSVLCDLVTLEDFRQEDQAYNIPDSCRKQSAMCHLPDFLSEQRAKLNEISAYLIAHPKCIKNQARVEKFLTEIQADPRAALGQNACWSLGDIIIILQAPSNALIWTLDADYKPLCTVLGLSLYESANVSKDVTREECQK